ncbi:ATP-dependent translocase ABCB1-like isoform X5 [Phycodurus eques]|uniref:ATP-dependent translocase ABCB1-like isoform X5 n=1 Tax=Phycodurus eques TaxID=693459 RepID=UPI002ACD4307|nr:ATP-dependent translocase ABCB1-like isoform X5 [Phycodurus eques]
MDEKDTLQKDSTELYLSELKNEKNKVKKAKIPKVGPIGLFRFADGLDVVLIVFGTVMSIVHGLTFPLMCVIFGNVADTFVQYSRVSKINTSHANSTTIIPNNTLQENITSFAIYYSIIGAILMVAAYIQAAFFALAAGRQIKRIRTDFFHSIMRQNIGWFDVNETATLNTRLVDDICKIQEGIGDKMGMLIQSVSTFILSIIIGFSIGWKLALVILAICPLLGLSAALFTRVVTSYTSKEQAAYAKAGAVAEEVLSAIRTVFAFNGQQKELERYRKSLEAAKKMGVERSISSNLIMGFTFMLMYLSYALAFWYGSTRILSEDKEYSLGTVLTVLFTLLAGTFALGQTSPNLEAFVIAQGAAHQLYTIIDRKPPIDSSSESGFKPDSVNGNIEFKNIHFNYPSRPGVKVLNNMSLSVKSGQTIALVGSSGCGKSTTIQLLQRFYDPQEGSISIDDHDIRSLNIRYLRGMIGVVSQEPVLFATTIAENIRGGRTNVTQHELEQAAKEANAYDFIMNLPDKFETLVGDRGTQMSGGQKQRIAIARALVRQPKILLLDEATSALDSESETIVQAALDKVRLGRTTIIVAHRLSTIRNADMIAGFQHGEVVELGTHSQLMGKKGVYHTLITMQMFQKAKDEDQQNCEHNDKRLPAKTSSESSTYRWKSTKSSSSAGVEQNKESENLVDDKDQTEKVENGPPSMFLKVMRFNLPEWPYILLGIISAAITGISQPVCLLSLIKR